MDVQSRRPVGGRLGDYARILALQQRGHGMYLNIVVKEALESGRPFKRKAWKQAVVYIFNDGFEDNNPIYAFWSCGKEWKPCYEDMIADDWELGELPCLTEPQPKPLQPIEIPKKESRISKVLRYFAFVISLIALILVLLK